MDERVAANVAHWNELAKIHERPSDYYDVDAFRAGGISLRPLEREEVGDVRGKSLLHLRLFEETSLRTVLVNDPRQWKRETLQEPVHLLPREALLRSARECLPPHTLDLVTEPSDRVYVRRDPVVGVVPVQLLHQCEVLRLQRVMPVPTTPLAKSA